MRCALADHDIGISRLLLILTKLDNNEKPTMKDLAREFNVSLRTIQRDLNRLQYFDIQKNEDKTFSFANGFTLKRVGFDDIELMILHLSLSMVDDISNKFSSTINTLKAKLLIPDFSSPYLIKQDPFESIRVDSQLIKDLEYSINNTRIITIESKKLHYEVEPYKIVCFDELWYLFAKEVHSKLIKTYFISDISNIDVSQKTYTLSQDIQEHLERAQSAYFDVTTNFEVTIKVLQPIAHFFKKKKHLLSQKILKDNKDGSLIISFDVTSDEDVDNLIKAWIPHIEVISPERFRCKILQELEGYLSSLKK